MGCANASGFARALVLEPDLLLMDEPFSALDVLTAENLRTELMALWAGENFPTRAICLVTHNIEEAVLLADRVIVLGANPGHIRAELRVELDRPRDRRSPAFAALVDKLYGMLTGVEPGVTEPEPTEATPTSRATSQRDRRRTGRSRRDRLRPRRQRRHARHRRRSSTSRSTTCSRWSTPPRCSTCFHVAAVTSN